MLVQLPMQQQLLASEQTGTLAVAPHRTWLLLAPIRAGEADLQC